MKKLLFIILMLCASFVLADTIPNDNLTIGDSSSSNDAKLLFDVGDGSSNPAFSVNKTSKEFSLSKNLNVKTNEFTLGAGSGADIKWIFDIGSGASNPFIPWDNTNSRLSFANDGTNAKPLGTGGGGDGGINVLENGDAEAGTNGFTFTGSGTFGNLTGADQIYKGDASFNLDFSAASETLKSDEYTIGGGLRGQGCQAEFAYYGGDSNIEVKVFNGNDTQLGDTHTIAASTIWTKESIFFPCASADAIGLDSELGNIYLEFSSTANAAAIRLDDLYLGSLKGLVETTLPDVFSAYINSSGTVVSENVDWINGNCSTGGTSTMNCSFNSGIFTVAPVCQFSIANDDNENGAFIKDRNVNTTGLQYTMRNSSNTASYYASFITCTKQGADAKQSVMVYKSIPTASDNTNNFSARITDSGPSVVSDNADFISAVNRTGTGVYNVVFNSSLFSVTPAVTCTPFITGGECTQNAISTSQATIHVRNSSGTLTSSDFIIKVSRQDTDVKQKIVQPVVIPNAVYYPEYDLTVSGTNLTPSHATAIPKQIGGEWFVDIKINGTTSSSFTVLTVTITGLTFDTGYNQSGGGYTVDQGTGTTNLTEVNFNGGASTMDIVAGAGTDLFVTHGNMIKLSTKPSWL
jgi:hypothetical protein